MPLKLAESCALPSIWTKIKTVVGKNIYWAEKKMQAFKGSRSCVIDLRFVRKWEKMKKAIVSRFSQIIEELNS